MNSIDVIKIYKDHTELVNQETVELACQSGCDLCCKQLAPCTKVEWDAISNFLVKNKLHTKIRKQAKKTLDEWKKYRKANIATMNLNPMKVFDDWLGKPCIFLDKEGACSIYEVRPMNCRTLTSTVKCESHNQIGCMQFRFEYDKPMSEPIWKSGHAMVLPDLFLG